MTILILIILIVLIAYWFYYRSLSSSSSFGSSQVNSEWMAFMKSDLGSSSLTELKAKLAGKTLNEILEENEDYETEVDTLTRTKNSLEADLLAQSNAFQNRLKEKVRELKKLQENLTSEKQQHKGSLGRIAKLSEQLTNLTKTHQDQLRKINLLFDPQAQDYQEIDFNGLYKLLKEKQEND